MQREAAPSPPRRPPPPPPPPGALPAPAMPPASVAAADRRGVRLEQVWLAVVLVVTFAAANGFPVDQTDYWWTVKLGEGLLDTRALPKSDPLAFTATREPYVEQQWLAQVVLAGVHRLGGLEAALLLRAALLVAAMA